MSEQCGVCSGIGLHMTGCPVPDMMNILSDTVMKLQLENAALKATLERVEAERNELRELIISLGDEEPCEYDHHDYCQAHLLHERPCPYGKANELRAALREGE